jgi:hypothetical protein
VNGSSLPLSAATTWRGACAGAGTAAGAVAGFDAFFFSGVGAGAGAGVVPTSAWPWTSPCGPPSVVGAGAGVSVVGVGRGS